jgi:uroporphyrinogen-III decarboxylase
MREPDKNRYLRAIKHIESEEIPFQEDEIEITVASKILGRQLPMVRPYELPAEDYIELCLRAGNDLVYVARVWELGRKNFIDGSGRKHYVDGTIKTRDDLKGIVFPDISMLKQRIEEIFETVEGTNFGIKFTPNQAPFVVATAIGYSDYYQYMLTDPSFIHQFQDMIGDYCLKELELALDYPVDIIQVGAVICSKTGPMFRRELIEEFEYPSLRQRVNMAKSKGVPVSIHMDGNYQSLIPDFIEMGIDVINPVEPCDGAQDVFRIKEQYGDKIAIHGDIDLAGVLVRGSPEDVAREVEEHCRRLGRGGGYVCGSSHNITENVPVENFYAMRDTVHNFRFPVKS